MYALSVVTVPTHRPPARWDHPPHLFLTRQKKLDTVVHKVPHPLGWCLILSTTLQYRGLKLVGSSLP